MLLFTVIRLTYYTRTIQNFVAMVHAIFTPYFVCTVYVCYWPLYYLYVKINEWQHKIPSNYRLVLKLCLTLAIFLRG